MTLSGDGDYAFARVLEIVYFESNKAPVVPSLGCSGASRLGARHPQAPEVLRCQTSDSIRLPHRPWPGPMRPRHWPEPRLQTDTQTHHGRACRDASGRCRRSKLIVETRKKSRIRSIDQVSPLGAQTQTDDGRRDRTNDAEHSTPNTGPMHVASIRRTGTSDATDQRQGQ